MKQTNTIKMNLFGQGLKFDQQMQRTVSNTMYANELEIDAIPNEDDVIIEHEPVRKIEISFGLDACMYQHMMKY